MSSLDEELRKRVQGARDSYDQEQENRRQQLKKQADEDERRKERGKALLDEIQKRFKEAADASDGAMKYGGALMDGIGQTAYDLYWEQPPPARGLRVSVNYFDGIVAWTWLLRGEEGRSQIDALRFEMSFLDRLILGLADQGTWSNGNLPRV